MEARADGCTPARVFTYLFLLTETRTDTDQVVRVFRKISVMVHGYFRMTFTSIESAGPLPRLEGPVSSSCAAWFGTAAFAVSQNIMSYKFSVRQIEMRRLCHAASSHS